MAGGDVIGGMFDHFGLDLGADRHRVGAAVLEAAAHGNVIGIGGFALQGSLFDRFDVFKGGHSLEQGFGVGMQGLQVEVVGVANFEDLAQVHDDDLAADVPDDAQVVGDEQHGEVQVLLKLMQQIDDLCLDGNIQRGDRFVGDKEFRVDGEGPGDDRALTLSARKGDRLAFHGIGRKSNTLQKRGSVVFSLISRADVVDLDDLFDHAADGQPRVEGGIGVLKDHLHLAAVLLELLFGQAGDVGTAVKDPAFIRFIQADEAAGQGTLARPAFSDQADGLTGGDSQGNLVEGVQRLGLFADQCVHPVL